MWGQEEVGVKEGKERSIVGLRQNPLLSLNGRGE